MSYRFGQRHGDMRSNFDGDEAVPKTIGIALSLLTVFVAGIWLIIHGLM